MSAALGQQDPGGPEHLGPPSVPSGLPEAERGKGKGWAWQPLAPEWVRILWGQQGTAHGTGLVAPAKGAARLCPKRASQASRPHTEVGQVLPWVRQCQGSGWNMASLTSTGWLPEIRTVLSHMGTSVPPGRA